MENVLTVIRKYHMYQKKLKLNPLRKKVEDGKIPIIILKFTRAFHLLWKKLSVLIYYKIQLR
jgi:hypothetical protein